MALKDFVRIFRVHHRAMRKDAKTPPECLFNGESEQDRFYNNVSPPGTIPTDFAKSHLGWNIDKALSQTSHTSHELSIV
jgi:hypothetical protein